VISRTFHKFHFQYDHQVFTDRPEQTLGFVMRALKALVKGTWSTCTDFMTGLDIWTAIPGDDASVQISELMTSQIELEGLRFVLSMEL
jgi:hypothetical protein